MAIIEINLTKMQNRDYFSVSGPRRSLNFFSHLCIAHKKAPSPGLLMHELIDILLLPKYVAYTGGGQRPALLAPRSHRKELLSFQDSNRLT